MSIMNRLKDMREDRDLSQKEVAEILGILQSDYSKYELGKHSMGIDSLGKGELRDFLSNKMIVNCYITNDQGHAL